MKRIAASQFKEQCLALLDQVGPEGIVITKHGKPVARLLPIHTESASLIGSLKGKIKIKGRILSTGVTSSFTPSRAISPGGRRRFSRETSRASRPS